LEQGGYHQYPSCEKPSNAPLCSAGGIVAIGLGICRLSVKECSDLVKRFATGAFTKRMGSDLPGVGFLVEAINHSRYESAGLSTVLESGFGENSNKRIFGETHDWSSRRLVRAGVTLTSSTGHPYFVANYNRALHDNGKKSIYISRIY